MIEKKIHYIWFGNKEYSKLIKKCMSSWQKNLPDYEFKLWNEENAPLEIAFVKDALEKKQYAFAADYVRSYALYYEGGIYLDTDVEVIKDFEPLLSEEVFLGYESKDFANAAVVGSRKGHILPQLLMEKLESLDEFKTIPKIISEVLTENSILLKENKITIYPQEYFYPYNPYDRERKNLELMFMDITENTYAIHHWEKGWKLSGHDRFMYKIKKFLHNIKI